MVRRGDDPDSDACNTQEGLQSRMLASVLEIWLCRVGLMLTCHFKQEGLKLGELVAASRSEMKTCSVGKLCAAGGRCGSSLGGYVSSGNLSKRCWRGVGTRVRDHVLCGAGRCRCCSVIASFPPDECSLGW